MAAKAPCFRLSRSRHEEAGARCRSLCLGKGRLRTVHRLQQRLGSLAVRLDRPLHRALAHSRADPVGLASGGVRQSDNDHRRDCADRALYRNRGAGISACRQWRVFLPVWRFTLSSRCSLRMMSPRTSVSLSALCRHSCDRLRDVVAVSKLSSMAAAASRWRSEISSLLWICFDFHQAMALSRKFQA